jgi:hypothetical protein
MKDEKISLLEQASVIRTHVEMATEAIGMLWLCDTLDIETKVRMSQTTADGIKAMREALRTITTGEA